jgi:hypothetical protein
VNIANDISQLIGGTPRVRLRGLSEGSGATNVGVKRLLDGRRGLGRAMGAAVPGSHAHGLLASICRHDQAVRWEDIAAGRSVRGPGRGAARWTTSA